MNNRTTKLEFVIPDDVDQADWSKIQRDIPLKKSGIRDFYSPVLGGDYDESPQCGVGGDQEELFSQDTFSKVSPAALASPSVQRHSRIGGIPLTAAEFGGSFTTFSVIVGWCFISQDWQSGFLASLVGFAGGLAFMLMNKRYLRA